MALKNPSKTKHYILGCHLTAGISTIKHLEFGCNFTRATYKTLSFLDICVFRLFLFPTESSWSTLSLQGLYIE